MSEILAAVGLAAFILFLTFVAYTTGAERGQIDCINGNVYYELVVNEDGSSNWERK
jgi:hypothetical protein